MAEAFREFTRFHLMNVERRQAAAAQARWLRLWVRLYRLPESTPTIAIYYYYSARKLILILPSHVEGWGCCAAFNIWLKRLFLNWLSISPLFCCVFYRKRLIIVAHSDKAVLTTARDKRRSGINGEVGDTTRRKTYNITSVCRSQRSKPPCHISRQSF